MSSTALTAARATNAAPQPAHVQSDALRQPSIKYIIAFRGRSFKLAWHWPFAVKIVLASLKPCFSQGAFHNRSEVFSRELSAWLVSYSPLALRVSSL